MATSPIVTAIIYTALAILLLLFLSSSNQPHSRHRRLKLRPPPSSSSDRHRPPIPFDPIISNIEQKREDRQWERTHFHLDSDGDDHAPGHEAQPEWEDFMDAEDYINDEERFNVTHRIQLLFPKIDVAPADGFASADELAEWNFQIALREVMHRTSRDMELHDKNKDGFVALGEYDPPSWSRRDDEDNTSSSYNMGWWKEDHFNASDVDGNGLLNLTEFNDFLHPADSTNPKLIQWLCKEEIRERDQDKDGKLDFQEFFRGLFDSIRNYDEVHNESDTSETAPAKKLFQDLDKDNDGFLSEDELKAVIGNLHPSEHYYAKQQADYALSQADTDKDGRLTLTEMIEHPYVFYSSIFNDEDDDDDFHDEFR
ncbi:developmentally-regulated G-protein 2 [Iris pallida]|uniref:Developmentally-regulated G-protein 2 n=1 Tax=Iris pallida TaxID=29817 RepID=A0AAX6G378_IRIPA|nr:developmentally-regulated G-protein 2 [Iris pallida]